MSLTSQFDALTKKWISDLKKKSKVEAQRLLNRGIQIFKDSVPIDTEQLKNSISGRIEESSMGFILIIEVPNVELIYGKRSINAVKLGLILERGRGKGNVRLTRTRDNSAPFAKVKQPTEEWFEKALNLWEKEIPIET